MLKLENYANKYQTIQMSRTDGILEVKLHTNGGPLHWSLLPHGELTRAFHEIGQDYDNEVIILTGTGAAFSGPALGPNGHAPLGDFCRPPSTPQVVLNEGLV